MGYQQMTPGSQVTSGFRSMPPGYGMTPGSQVPSGFGMSSGSHNLSLLGYGAPPGFQMPPHGFGMPPGLHMPLGVHS